MAPQSSFLPTPPCHSYYSRPQGQVHHLREPGRTAEQEHQQEWQPPALSLVRMCMQLGKERAEGVAHIPSDGVCGGHIPHDGQ